MSTGNQWSGPELLLRLALSLAYILVLYPVILLAGIIILLQWLIIVAPMERLRPLDDFAGRLVGFFTQVLNYVFFLKDQQPFPFNPIVLDSVNEQRTASAVPPPSVKVEVVTEKPAANKGSTTRKKSK